MSNKKFKYTIYRKFAIEESDILFVNKEYNTVTIKITNDVSLQVSKSFVVKNSDGVHANVTLISDYTDINGKVIPKMYKEWNRTTKKATQVTHINAANHLASNYATKELSTDDVGTSKLDLL